jgi:hypothetical protein
MKKLIISIQKQVEVLVLFFLDGPEKGRSQTADQSMGFKKGIQKSGIYVSKS